MPKIILLSLLLIETASLSGCATILTANGSDGKGAYPNKTIYQNYQCGKSDSPIIYASTQLDFHFLAFPFVGDDTISNNDGQLGLLGMLLYPGFIIVGLADLPISLVTDSLLLPYTIPKTYLTCINNTK